MTAKMTRNILLMLVATVLMGIVLNLYIHNTGTVPAADNAAPLTDGSYTSAAQGCMGEVTVTVTVTGGKVTVVQVDASAETPELGGKAAETLAAQLTQTGSTAGVDAEVRLYDKLFTEANMNGIPEGSDYKDYLNPESVTVRTGCKLEESLKDAKPGEKFQFVRTGFFTPDSKNPGVYNRVVTLRDSFKPAK